MARNSVRQGARFELEVMHHLEQCARDCQEGHTHREYGYTSLRSSGSRGAVDIVAVAEPRWLGMAWSLGHQLLFIQCKISNPLLPPAERLAVMGLALRAGALPIVAYKAHEGPRRPIRFRELTGPGPKEWREWAPPTIEEN